MRCYGPTEALNNKTFKLPDFETVASSDVGSWPFCDLRARADVRFAPEAALPVKSHFDPEQTWGGNRQCSTACRSEMLTICCLRSGEVPHDDANFVRI
jgi:hypothetical protein